MWEAAPAPLAANRQGETDGLQSDVARTAASAANAAGPPRFTQDQLNQLIDAHERFVRRQPRGQRAIWRFMQFSQRDFAKRLMSDADLTGANLQRCRLILTNFERATLFCADLSDTDARAANFSRADIRGASLRNANLGGANLNDADMRQAVLARADGEQGFRVVGRPTGQTAGGDQAYSVDFTNCSMKRAKLASAKLTGANFTGALLQDADLKGANLEGAKFEGAVMTGVDLEQVRLSPGALAKCVVDPSADALKRGLELVHILKAAAQWVVSDGAEGKPGVLDDEDLRPLGSALERRRLAAISCKRACAIGVSFVGSQLQGASFEGADLRDADFTDCDLRGASFRGANMRHARFTNADIQPLPLASGGDQPTDFDGADYAPYSLASCKKG